MTSWRIEEIDTDIAIVGGGTAGCMAAIAANRLRHDCRTVIIEKAHIQRSGCLAAGVNAINAYLNPGETVNSFVEFVRREAHGVMREDLVAAMAARLNRMTDNLAHWGVPIPRHANGHYLPRGKRSIEIYGERIKPIMAARAQSTGALVLNKTVAVDYIVDDQRVCGVYAFSLKEPVFYVIKASTVICTTGGASGLYRPNNPGSARGRMWYPPSNAGAGYAMGLRAGAEMTGLEMRFIALRVKDTIAPTGSVAQGVRVSQVNALGQSYIPKGSHATTAERLAATLAEEWQGRGPCYLDTTGLTAGQAQQLQEAYLDMCPSMVLWWADRPIAPQEAMFEICGTEPYVVGGHAQAGYWVDTGRATTVVGLLAAGDVAGGAPKKYVSGAMAEGEIAAETAVGFLDQLPPPRVSPDHIQQKLKQITAPLYREKGIGPDLLTEKLQKVMDEYAGGISQGYRLAGPRLERARQMLAEIKENTENMVAVDLYQLMAARETMDRILVAAALVEHLLYRRESRWPAYQYRLDFPAKDDRRWQVFVNSTYNPNTGAFRLQERPVR